MAANPPDNAVHLLSEEEYEQLPDDQKVGYRPVIRYKPTGFKEITKGGSKGKFAPATMHVTGAAGETWLAGEEV